MRNVIERIANESLKKFDIRIVKRSYIKQLEKNLKAANVMKMLLECPLREDLPCGPQDAKLLKALRHSRSQLGQDLFALSYLGFRPGGYFVEFGATNGIDLSNSYLLETQFGWNGIVAEPARRWHTDLRKNRICHIETNCVWRESDSVLTFNEADSGEYSTIDSYSSSDENSQKRRNGQTYSVETISLKDLLDKYKAPGTIDFLSIDTEGSEYEILRNFEFNKYQFRVITCEHNYGPEREEIFALLTGHGYVRKFEELSTFDDWYVKTE